MSIIRTSHDKSNPYVVLNKRALEEPNLSFAAKGLWSFLLSRPDNWNISVSHLVSVFGGAGPRGQGEKFIYAVINELIEHGYIEKEQQRDRGAFDKVNYVIYEHPLLKESLPQLPQRRAVERHAPQEGLISNDLKEVKNNNNKLDDVGDNLKEFDLLIEELEKRKTPVFSDLSNRAALLKLSKNYSAKLVGQIIYRFVLEKPKVHTPMGWLIETVKDEYELFKYKQREKNAS